MNKIIIFLLFIFLSLGILYLVGFLFHSPINFIDEGQFGSWVTNMEFGKYMYKDIYITYGPLYVQYIKSVVEVFFPRLITIRFALFALSSVTTLFAVILLLNELKVRRLLIALCCSWMVFLLPHFSVRQALGLLVVWLLITALKSSNKLFSFLLGVLLAISFLVSPEVGVFSFIVIFVSLVYALAVSQERRVVVYKYALFLIGCCVVFLPFIAVSSSQGWFKEYVETTVDVMITLSGSSSPIGQAVPDIKALFLQSLSPFSFIKFLVSKEMLLYVSFIFAIFLIQFNLIRLISQNLKKVGFSVLLISVFSVLLTTTLIGRSGVGHYLVTLGPVFILLTYFLNNLFYDRIGSKQDIVVKRIIGAIIILFVARIVFISHPVISSAISSNYLALKTEESHSQLKKFVETTTNNNDTIFILSDEPGLYFCVDRSNATRYDLPFIANSKEKNVELLDDLAANNPVLIIENTKAWSVDDLDNRMRISGISLYINKNYSKCANIGSYQIYCLINES